MNLFPLTIIGAGVAGLVAGLRWAQGGGKIGIFEAGPTVGHEASGLALGVLVPSGLQRPVDALQRAGCAAWPELAAELAALTGTPVAEFYRTWPQGQQLRLPQTLQVLAQAIEKLGGKVHLNSPIATLPAATPEGPVLLAAGWGNTQLGGLPQTVASGQVLRLRLASPPPDALRLFTGENVFLVPDWLTPDGSQTFLLGSHNWTQPTPGPSQPNPEFTQILMAKAARLHPAFQSAEVVDAWVGHRPISNPRLLLIRPLAPHTWAVAGLGKTGYALAPMVAEELLKIYH